MIFQTRSEGCCENKTCGKDFPFHRYDPAPTNVGGYR